MSEDFSAPANDLSQKHDTFPFSKFFLNEDLLTITGTERKIPRSKLINQLNHLNFVDRPIELIFYNGKPHQNILLQAYPQPCLRDSLTCHLVLDGAKTALAHYQPRFLMIDDGLDVIMAPIQLSNLHEHMITVSLPEEGLVKTKRSTRRHRCDNVDCELVRDDKKYGGRLVDFTPNAFSIQLSDGTNRTEFAPDDVVLIHLYQKGVKLYSGICRCVRDGGSMPEGRLVCAPVNEEARLFPKRITRNPRRHIPPSFTISYRHPFLPKRVERDVFDVSTSGFSIHDSLAEQTLMAGMIIPELSICYAGVIEMKCSAQVVYHREDRENNVVQTGLAITDMDVRSFSYLNHLVGADLDPYARVSMTVDMNALWEFFFDTGFIYGEKYQHLYPYRDSFKETYRKLYQDNPEIARHFTYEKNGTIYGHIAMVHAYEPSWVIHHFSAKPMESKIPGFLILRQITHYINGYYRFLSQAMDYVMTYYRPDNRIVDKVFGGFARELSNPKGSSLDLFSYLHLEKSSAEDLTDGFTLGQCTPDDFAVLKTFYETSSGGLLLDAFRLDLPIAPLKNAFSDAGFKRDCATYCLRHDNKPSAFLIVNHSDVGLNLSDLLNCVTVFIADGQPLSWKTLSSAVNHLTQDYDADSIPLLLYPSGYPESQGIHVGKQYQLWILKNDPYSEQYTNYMERKFRMKYSGAPKT